MTRPEPQGDCPVPTLTVDWKFVLWREENKYQWTGVMDTATLPETGVLNDCLLSDEWRIPPALFLSVGSQNASNQTSPSHKRLESSLKSLTDKRKDPKVVTSEITPRSLHSKVQKQEAYLYTTT